MAKAQNVTYQIEQSGVEPGCFNLNFHTLDNETASFLLAALLARDPYACSVGRMVPQTEALEEAAHERAVRLANLRPGHNSVCCCAPPNSVEMDHSVPQGYRTPRPDRQRPLDGRDAGLYRGDRLRETEASATHALRDLPPHLVVADYSRDLRWFHHATLEGVDTASYRGLSFEPRDATDDCGVRLKIAVEHGPPVPVIWVGHFNCATDGSCWFGNDAEAKRAALKVAEMRALQVDGDGHVTGH